MHVVPRHDIDRDRAKSRAEGFGLAVDDALEDLERFPRGLVTLQSLSLVRMKWMCGADPQVAKGHTWAAVVEAMQVASAGYALAERDSGTVACRIRHREYELPATGPKVLMDDPGSWLNALWLAMACLEKERTDMLCDMPVDRLQEEGFDPYLYDWVSAIQMYWRGEDGYFDQLMAALRRSDPDDSSVRDPGRALLLEYPAMRMFGALVQDEHEEFNEALVQALEAHRSYWTANAERADDAMGTMALAPTALATFARVKGFPIEVESDYLPKHLVQADWYGEFPT